MRKLGIIHTLAYIVIVISNVKFKCEVLTMRISKFCLSPSL